jgi:hypothetical protein
MTRPPAGHSTGDAAANGTGKITRDAVLAAALQIIDADGADGLSMRRLARALGRDPMILYRHAPNKAALLDGVAETVLAQLEVDAADPGWATQLRAVARNFRQLALAHPHVVPLLVTRPLATPLALRPPAPCARSKTSWPCSPTPGSPGPTPCTSTAPCSGSCTATSSTNSRNSSTTPTKPTTCYGSACTGCPSPNSPCCAASPPPWPPTTAPPNSNADSTSSSPDSPPHSPPRRNDSPRGPILSGPRPRVARAAVPWMTSPASPGGRVDAIVRA